MSHTRSVSQKLFEECFCNYPTYRSDVSSFLISLTHQWDQDSPAWLTEEGPAQAIVPLWLRSFWAPDSGAPVDQCLFSQTGNFARSCLLSPDKQRGREDREKHGSVQPLSYGPGSHCDNRTWLSLLIKAYQQHLQQALALVERCTSVTQNKRGAVVIRAARLLRGTTPSPNPTSTLFQNNYCR